MRTAGSITTKIAVIAGVSVLTLAVHYGWLLEPIFGHVHWVHAIHGRLCYIPIVIAAAWFGLRGGLITAAAISLLVLPYVVGSVENSRDLASETVEIVFYFAIATLAGLLFDRELSARRRRQEAELQMERSQKLSLAGQIAAGVAHEIKNPLASIKGAADILADDGTSHEDREEFKGILRTEIKRIDTTVAEFLEFARPKESRLRKINLTDTLRSTIRQIETHAKRQHVSIDSQLEDGIIVKGDPDKLHQMTLNLVLNAIQASREGDLINVNLKTSTGAAAQLTVTDSGVGIAKSDIEHVFEPFFTTKTSGTGLGLAIVKTIVDGHRGDISIESREHHGTTITVTLPLYTE
ncbi:MAG: hypothetical protein JSW58_12800 [Candidatus Latescibacterota bacterium]|nr:MAG: hypothetical protein JSW58_12800 [Candidatus Latescibacterota bacterium]